MQEAASIAPAVDRSWRTVAFTRTALGSTKRNFKLRFGTGSTSLWGMAVGRMSPRNWLPRADEEKLFANQRSGIYGPYQVPLLSGKIQTMTV